MKKFFGVFVLIFVVAFGAFVLVTTLNSTESDQPTQTELNLKEKFDSCCDQIYPFYASLDEEEKNYYVKLCAGFEDYSETVKLITSDSKSDIKEANEWVNENYRYVAYEQPDYFWVDPNSFTLKELSQGKQYSLSIDIKYNVSEKEAKEKKKEYDAVVNEIVEGAVSKEYLFDAVLYAYDTILEKTDYDHSLAEETKTDLIGFSAYGCLVEGKTVCSGYTLAFTSIMQKLGLTCGAEFDAEAEKEDADGGHVWNYCKLGSDYYYFDLTWDDTGFDSDELRQYLDYTHNFFAVTEKELSYTHESMKSEPTSPECTAVGYNYYTYMGYDCGNYSFSKMKTIAEKQRNNDFVVVKFNTPSERIKAERELFKNEKFYDMFPGVKQVKYIASASGLQLYLFFDK